MKRALAIIMTVVMLLTSSVILTSCSDDEGKTINAYYVSNMYDFDPSLAVVDDDAMEVFNLVYEPLFTLKENGKVKKALADDYEINKEENSMTITLSETYWSDGQQVTNEDILFAWQRILDPNTQNPAASLLYEIKNAVNVKRGEDDNGNTVTISDIGIEITGTKTLKIFFENANVDYNAFLRNLTNVALTPLREDVVAQRTDYWSKRKATVVTNGPFTFQYIDYDEGTFTLARNKFYNRNPNENSSVKKYVTPYAVSTKWMIESTTEYNRYHNRKLSANVVQTIANLNAAYLDEKLQEFVDGTIFYIGELSLQARKEYKENKLLTLSDSMSTYTYVMNNSLFPADVRAALSSVIDREYIVNEITIFGIAATGFISNGVFEGTDRKTDYREENSIISTSVSNEAISSAQSVINAAHRRGSFDKSKTYVIKCKNAEEDIMVAKYVSELWKQLFNITTQIQIVSWNEKTVIESGENEVTYRVNELQTDYISGNYDIIAIDYQMMSTDAFVTLAGFSSKYNGNGASFYDTEANRPTYVSRLHSCGYSNAEYDALIESAYVQKDLDERVKILHEAEKILLRDMPVIPLYFNQNYYLTSKKLKNIKNNYYALPVFTKAKLTAKVEETK